MSSRQSGSGRLTTATYCRGCIAKWHKIPAGKALSERQQEYLVKVIMTWIIREMHWEAADDIQTKDAKKSYDKDNCRPVLRCSICNGEQVAGFKNIHTGKFEEVTLIRNDRELKEFMEMYEIDHMEKEY